MLNGGNLRHLLQKEFVKRCKRNPAYSMRAYASFLEIDQSLLSKIMRGERSISKENSRRLGFKLGLGPAEVNVLLKKSPTTERYLPLDDDSFNLIADWYHFAILELIKTRSCKSDIKLMAKKLGIHVEEARTAIERMQRMGLIRQDRNTFSLSSASNTWTNTHATSEARKRLQKSLLERSLAAIETVPFELRENGSLTVAINKSRLPEFKEKLKRIRQELGEFFQQDTQLDEVYQLTLAFFPLTKINGDKS